MFLSDLKSFFELYALPSVFWGMMASDHLDWRTKLQWDCKKESLKLQRGANYHSVSWQDFKAFMQRSFASLTPAREAQQLDSKLKQTGSVRVYVHDMMQILCEQRTVFHPGSSVFDDLIDGLKLGVQDNAPTGWWTDMNDLYQKALDYELIGLVRGWSYESDGSTVGQSNRSNRFGQYGEEEAPCFAGKPKPQLGF